jgi:hypothetical protein
VRIGSGGGLHPSSPRRDAGTLCDAARHTGAAAALTAATYAHQQSKEALLDASSVALGDMMSWAALPSSSQLFAMLPLAIDVLTHHASNAVVARRASVDVGKWFADAPPVLVATSAPRAATAIGQALQLQCCTVQIC